MTIGVSRGDRGTRPPINFPKKNPIWPPRCHEIIKMAITSSAFVIETYIWTLYLGFEAHGESSGTVIDVREAPF